MEGAVAQDAGVGDDDVDLAEGVDRGLDDRLAALGGVDAVRVGDGFAAGRLDLLDDLVGHLAAGLAFAVAAAAEVVDDDLGAARGEEQAWERPEAAAGAGDDGDAAIESNITH